MEYGADNLFKNLRSVLLVKPVYYDIVEITTPWEKKWVGKINKEKAIEQHQLMVDILENEGVRCYFMEPIKECPDQKNSRDVGYISSNGVAVANMTKKIRKNEKNSMENFCKNNNIPIISQSINFEGGDVFHLDNESCIIGVGPRTSKTVSLLKNILKIKNLELIHHESHHHLDAVFNILSREYFVVSEDHIVSYEKKELESYLDSTAILLDENDIETMAANFLLLKKNKVLADVGCHEFNKKLEKIGVDVIETDVSELKKDGGSVRCMTLPLSRR